MRFGRRDQAERVRAVDITSMIDVVFLLIIFFMVSARYARDTRAELDLPREQGTQEEESAEAGLIVNIMSDGTLIVGTDTLTLAELDERVRAAISRLPGRDARQLKLMIRADRNADTASMNAVIKNLRALGVGGTRLGTEVPR